ncbi:MAG: hypothetical protein M3Q31_25165 [Actinomycetota bacterium]|nr:hypothetical protein [Actinomycetota bacterium]
MSSAEYPLAPDPALEWTGAKRHYDLVKEFVFALIAVALLTVVLAAVFSSPDEKPVTVAGWANAAPQDFLATALGELDGTSGTAGYGPPYTHVSGSGQNILGGISLQRIVGVRIPIDPTEAFVLDPLSVPAQSDPQLAAALATYQAAPNTLHHRWTGAYTKALAHITFQNGAPVLPSGRYGPVATLMAGILAQARSGGLDGALISTSRFYQTDYTKPLLFLADGSYLSGLAEKQNLLGEQWGMMNETGNYPGQPWLWLYTFWYQVPPFSTSDNADAQIWAIMALLSLGFVAIPFIPGVRSIPRYLPLYRLIWRDYYRTAERQQNAPGSNPNAAGTPP